MFLLCNWNLEILSVSEEKSYGEELRHFTALYYIICCHFLFLVLFIFFYFLVRLAWKIFVLYFLMIYDTTYVPFSSIYVCVSHIHHEFFWQSNLTSQDLSFIGYTYKNFEAVKGLHQSLGKSFCFILEIIHLLYFYFIIFHPVEMFGFVRRMFRPCNTLLPPYIYKKKLI